MFFYALKMAILRGQFSPVKTGFPASPPLYFFHKGERRMKNTVCRKKSWKWALCNRLYVTSTKLNPRPS